MDRLLGGLERRFYLLATGSRINIVGWARVEGPLGPGAWRAALDEVQHRHPLLGVHVEGGPPGLRFVRGGTARIPLEALPRADDEHFLRAIDRELHLPFPPGPSPLVRSVLLYDDRGADALVTVHHVVGDALSVLRLYQDALGVAAGHLEGAPVRLAPLAETPALAAMLPENPVTADLAARNQAARAHALETFQRMRPEALPRDGDAPPPERRSRLLHASLDEATTRALADTCKSHGASIHGAVAAAALQAVGESLPGGARALQLTSPVNLRPLLTGLPEGAFGYYAWGVTTCHRVEPARDFWDLAKEVRAAVSDGVGSGRMLVSLLKLEQDDARAAGRDHPTAEEVVQASLAWEPFAPQLQVSSFGRLDVPEQYGCLRWREFSAVDSRDNSGANLGFATHTFRGRMTVDLVHPEPLVSRQRAAKIHEAALRRLRRAAGMGHPKA